MIGLGTEIVVSLEKTLLCIGGVSLPGGRQTKDDERPNAACIEEGALLIG